MDLFGIDSSSPYNFTGGDLEQKLLSSIFGNDPAVSMLVGMALPHINKFLGLTSSSSNRSALLDMTLMSNMTPYGVYRDTLNNTANRLAGNALSNQSKAARRRWLENFNRTTMSFESWQDTASGKAAADLSPEQQQQAYNNYIANETAGQMNNFLWTTGYNLLDPDGINAANTYLQQAGANQIRFGAMRGTRTAMLQARAIGNMFMRDGKFDFQKEDYGFMNVGEASAIAAALTKDIDFFKGYGTGSLSKEQMQNAAEDLRKRVQDLTQAMGPLKDVFGSDIPAMIKAVEDISGKRLSSLDPSRVGTLVERVMANTVVGGYNIGQLVGMKQQVSGAISQMAVPFTNELGAFAQASTILNMTETGLTPAFMSDARYRQNAADWVLRTSNSSGAGYLNAAAAVWLDQNEGKTIEDFMAAYNTARDTMGATGAMMSLTGAENMAELSRMGMQSARFQEVTESDVGGQLARGESIRKLRRRAWLKSDNREAFDRGMDAIMENPELLSSPDALENSDLDEDAKKQIRWIRAGAGMGKQGEAFVTSITANAEAKSKAADAKRQQTLMKAANSLKEAWIPENMTEIVNGLLAGKDLGQIFEANATIAAVDPEMQTYLKSVAGASADYHAMQMYGVTDRKSLSDEQKAEVEKKVQEDLSYGFMNGLSNQMYQDALTGYEEATTQEEKLEYSKRMAIASEVDEERLADFVGEKGEGWGKGTESLTAIWDKALKVEGNTKAEAANEVTDFITYKNIEKTMQEQGIDLAQGWGKYFLKNLEEARTATKDGKDTYMGIDDAKAAITKLGLEEDSPQAEQLKNIVNQAYGKDSSVESKIEDLVGTVTNLLGKITGLSEKLDKVITKDGFVKVNLDLW